MKKLFVLLGLAALPLLAPNEASADTIFGVTTGNVLVSFDSSTPGSLITTVPIMGLRVGETIEGIDFRPANGLLYGLGAVGSSGVVYQFDLTTGAATLVVSGLVLSGDAFGFDFNPVPDALRIVSNGEQNLRIANNLTVVNVDGTLNPGNPNVIQRPARPDTLFVIDTGLSPDGLLTQGSPGGTPVSPNTGTLFTVGPLGLDSGGRVGFDITSDNRAFASLTVPPGPTSPAQLYGIDLTTGGATLIGAIAGDPIQAIAVAPASVPGPGTLTLLGFGVIGLLGYKRCRLGSRPPLE